MNRVGCAFVRLVMGCTQSNEPKTQNTEQQQTQQTAPAAAEPEKEAAPAPVAESAAESQTAPVAEPEGATIAEAPTQELQAAEAPKQEVMAVEAVEEVAPAVVVASEAVVEQPSGQAAPVVAEQQSPQVAPAIPTPVVPKKRAIGQKKPNSGVSANSRGTRSTPHKENSTSAKAAATKPKTATPMRSRGVGAANANGSHTAHNAPDKKVCFDAVPAPVDVSAKRTTKARKQAGKHGSNVNEAMLLASIAAFERQLTYAVTLDSQLHSR
jgi:hypothetical protein